MGANYVEAQLKKLADNVEALFGKVGPDFAESYTEIGGALYPAVTFAVGVPGSFTAQPGLVAVTCDQLFRKMIQPALAPSSAGDTMRWRKRPEVLEEVSPVLKQRVTYVRLRLACDGVINSDMTLSEFARPLIIYP